MHNTILLYLGVTDPMSLMCEIFAAINNKTDSILKEAKDTQESLRRFQGGSEVDRHFIPSHKRPYQTVFVCIRSRRKNSRPTSVTLTGESALRRITQ